jgi:hypothetical protein
MATILRMIKASQKSEMLANPIIVILDTYWLGGNFMRIISIFGTILGQLNIRKNNNQHEHAIFHSRVPGKENKAFNEICILKLSVSLSL